MACHIPRGGLEFMKADPMLADARRAYKEACSERLPMLEAVEERRERASCSCAVSWGWVSGWSFAAVGTGESAGNGSELSGADIAASVAEPATMRNSQVDKDHQQRDGFW